MENSFQQSVSKEIVLFHAFTVIFYLHRAMVDENSTDEERISLLRKTCSEHAVMYKDAMNGKGIDRHMFGLYVVSKGLGYVSTFTFTLTKC